MALITGIWNDIKVVCGNHEPDDNGNFPLLEIKSGPHSLYYCCPHYTVSKNSTSVPCFNRINLIDYEKMLAHLTEMIVNAEANDETICLTNHTWKEKTRYFEVISHKGDSIVVKMIDTAAIKGHKV